MRPGRQEWTGRVVVPGVVCGEVYQVRLLDLSAVLGQSPGDVSEEAERQTFRDALAGARQDLQALRARACEGAKRDGSWTQKLIAELLGAQVLILEDPLLLEVVSTRLGDGDSAFRAVAAALGELEQRFLDSESVVLHSRVQDLRSALHGVLRRLLGVPAIEALREARIVVATALGPAELLWLGRDKVAGLVLEEGTASDHTCVLAQTLGIPTLVGVAGLMTRVAGGETAIVDGHAGTVVLCPDKRELADARDRRASWSTETELASASKPLVTVDGVPLSLFASVELPEEGALAASFQATGIGLVRTEYLCFLSQKVLDETQQVQAYQELLRGFPCGPVTFRTFDFGADKALDSGGSFSPDTGRTDPTDTRGLSGALRQGGNLETQFRALQRVSIARDIQVLLPFVRNLEEFRSAKRLFAATSAAVAAREERAVNAGLGAMLEVLSAVAQARSLAMECDFIAVGTTDLVASVRGEEASTRFGFLDPRVIRALQTIYLGCAETGTPVWVCGSMLMEPLAFPLLLGLGYRSFSVPCASLPLIRSTLHALSLADCRRLVPELIVQEDGAAVARCISKEHAHALEGVWPGSAIFPDPDVGDD